MKADNQHETALELEVRGYLSHLDNMPKSREETESLQDRNKRETLIASGFLVAGLAADRVLSHIFPLDAPVSTEDRVADLLRLRDGSDFTMTVNDAHHIANRYDPTTTGAARAFFNAISKDQYIQQELDPDRKYTFDTLNKDGNIYTFGSPLRMEFREFFLDTPSDLARVILA